MKKILVVYNVSGIVRELWNMWENHLNTIINQKYDNYHICISGCRISETSKRKFLEIKKRYPNKISMIFTDEIHPVNVTFNKCCIEMSKSHNFDAFMYVASDVSFDKNEEVISNLINLHNHRNCGITVAVVNNDSGITPWLGNHVYEDVLNSQDFEIPIGRSCNMHCMLFDRKIFDIYGKIVPDIFRSFCTESTYSFLTASIGKKFMIHKKDVFLTHIHSADGSSGGFQGYRGWTDLYMSKKTVYDRLMTKEAWDCGFGYEECQNVFLHNKELYDGNGNHKNPQMLMEFIKKNLYLDKTELDYDNIKTEIV